MYLKKRMRTVVISGRGMKKIFICFLIICFFIALKLIFFAISRIPGPDGEMSVRIISQKYSGEGLDDVIKGILGFDPKDEKTIFYNYYSLFTNVDTVEASVESPPPEFEVQIATPVENEPEISEPAPKIEEVKISEGMKVTNSAGIEVDAEALANEDLHIKLDSSGPQVLIVHTHTTESFSGGEPGTGNDRSTDSSKNMIAIGAVINNILKQEGIETVHDTTVHDYPSYNGAYTRSKATVQKNLEKYPSIKVVLDVHRDGIVREDGTKVKVLNEINGEKAAQCMFVVGSNAQLKHDNWKDNMRLACKMQKYAEENYPGLMRPIMLRKERFNQQISRGAIIIEVGSNGNSPDEAKKGAEYMAKIIAAVLKNS